MSLRAILFDFDGTLVQTREATWRLFQKTSIEFSLGIDKREQFFDLFRGNFWESLDKLSGDNASAEIVRRHFQELLRREYCPPLIPGMPDIIRGLAAHYTLAVLSSNTMTAIRSVLANAGVAHCFAHVFSGDIEPDKCKAIGRFLQDPSYGFARHCTPNYDEAEAPRYTRADEVVLITDTTGDVAEATRAGIAAVGVAWGMHGERELLESGADFVAVWPQEILAYLLPGGVCSDQGCACEIAACVCTPEARATSEPDLAVAKPDVRGQRRQLAADKQRRIVDGAATPVAATHVPAPERPRSRTATAVDPTFLAALRRIQKSDDAIKDCTI